MAVVGLIADAHVHNFRRFGGRIEAGINRRCQVTLDTLSAAVAIARSRSDVVALLGDLFDVADPGPQVIAEAQKRLSGVVVLVGNHEQVSTLSGDHAVGPLAPVATVVDEPRVIRAGDVDLVCLPHVPRQASEWMEDAIPPKTSGRDRALLLHVGIATPDDPAFAQENVDVVKVRWLINLCRKHEISAVFSGHWHRHRILHAKDPVIVQVGALNPTGFSDSGLTDFGSLLFWDSEAKTVQREIIPGPRFVRIKAGEAVPAAPGCSLFVEIACEPEQVAAETERLVGTLSGQIMAGEVVIDDTLSIVAARTAAQEAKAATTLESALSGFVEQMPLPDGVDRSQVLATARKYLGM